MPILWFSRRQWLDFAALLCCLFATPAIAVAADNELTEAEKAEGWTLLFNGKDLTGFLADPKRGHHKWHVADGQAVLAPATMEKDLSYVNWPLWTEAEYEDYVLKFDFHFGPNPEAGHSAVVLRAIGKPNTYRQKSIEVDLFGPARKVGHFSTGAFRHMIKPASKVAMKPAGEWNAMQITVKGPNITVELNGEKVNEINLDEYTTAGKRPDGTNHLLPMALKDMPRTSAIGFRDDFGIPLWLKNVKLKPLK